MAYIEIIFPLFVLIYCASDVRACISFASRQLKGRLTPAALTDS